MTLLVPATLFLIYLNVPVVVLRELGLPAVLAGLTPLLFVPVIVQRLVWRGEPLWLPAPLVAAIGLGGVYVLSALASARPHEGLLEALLFFSEGLLLAVLVANVVRTRRELSHAVVALVAAGAVMGAVSLMQQLIGPERFDFFGFGQLDAQLTDDDGTRQPRLAGPIGETNRYAQVMVVLLPLCLAGLRTGLAVHRLAWLAAAALIFCGMTLTFSRGAFVALALSVPLALLAGLLRWRHVAVVAIALLATLALLPHQAERVASVGRVALQAAGITPAGMHNADSATRGRMTEMQAAGLMFLEHPVLGVGPGLAPHFYVDYARAVGGKVRPGRRRTHNLYLQLAAETGLVGLAAFASTIVLMLRALLRAADHWGRASASGRMAAGLALALVVFLATSLFLHAAYIRYFWLLAGLCASAAVGSATPRPRLRSTLAEGFDGRLALPGDAR